MTEASHLHPKDMRFLARSSFFYRAHLLQPETFLGAGKSNHKAILQLVTTPLLNICFSAVVQRATIYQGESFFLLFTFRRRAPAKGLKLETLAMSVLQFLAV